MINWPHCGFMIEQYQQELTPMASVGSAPRWDKTGFPDKWSAFVRVRMSLTFCCYGLHPAEDVAIVHLFDF
ncbi:MAG: hypothetical protein CL797_03195 [Chromatiales bacterium]|jgi:hypothetical protein|nr:hypothetical protein [Chromatiales bacterium]